MPVLVAIATGVGVWSGEVERSFARGAVVVVVLGLVTCLAACHSPRRVPYFFPGRGAVSTRSWKIPLAVLMVAVLAVGHLRSQQEWRAVHSVRLGEFRGEAILHSDPRQLGRGVRAVLEIEGQRYDVWAFGPIGLRLHRHRFGEAVRVTGVRLPPAIDEARRRHLRHVVGRFDVETMGAVSQGSLSRASPVERAAHRVRDVLGRGARTMDPDVAALFAGLVYGDDTGQSSAMIERFRRSGLAHLTAVSGQNVAYVLAMSTPILSRLRRPWRLAATVVILVWFAVVTRHEPSVIRAAVMAGVSATVAASGRRHAGLQILAIAVTIALVVDPFLAWSVGWWLSVSGATGLIVLSPLVFATVSSGAEPGWSARWIVPMIAAQIGVLPVSAAVFGVPSALSIPANLLAVPVAGLVMLIGLPAALVAGVAPDVVCRPMMLPLEVGVRWVDSVAALGAHLRPAPMVDRLVAGALVVALGSAAWHQWRRRSVPT